MRSPGQPGPLATPKPRVRASRIAIPSSSRCSLVMGPHPDGFHDVLPPKHLVDETMVDVDPARECSGEVSDGLLKRRRRLKGIGAENLDQSLGFGLETGAAQLLSILGGLRRKDDPPGAHQLSDSRHSFTGVANPLRIQARIPGIETRYNVS